MPLTDKGGPAQLNLWEGNGAPGLTARGGTGLPVDNFIADSPDFKLFHLLTGQALLFRT